MCFESVYEHVVVQGPSVSTALMHGFAQAFIRSLTKYPYSNYN